MSKKRLFGTDGIRGKTNQFPITPSVVLKVGQAVGYMLRKQPLGKAKFKKVVIGKDTRLSGYMIEQALSSGLNSMGVHVQLVGPLPTPGIGFLTRNMRADAGIVISASHNPFDDNGIKIFGADGYKIHDSMEQEIERLVLEEDLEKYLPPSREIGRTKRIDDSTGRYVVYVKNVFPLEMTLDGLRIVLDCANGAAYKVAPAVFEELGAEVLVIGDEPNGININDEAGALFPSRISEAVRTYRADVGISLDGDADRVIMVDEYGSLINGDHVISICAIYMKEMGQLAKNTIVATEMSNFGLDKAMEKNGIKVVRTGVGDKLVVEEMRKNGYVLGGEQSGHTIFLEHSTTGDGLIAALKVLAVMKNKKVPMSQLRTIMDDVPQVLINCRVKQRVPLEDISGYKELIDSVTKELKGEGRVFIRYSGTEPVVRILVEGPDKSQINDFAEKIANLLQGNLV